MSTPTRTIPAKGKNKQKSSTGFFLFSKDVRQQIHQACPFFSPLDISKVISEQWKNLPEVERVRYREMAKSLTEAQKKEQSPSPPKIEPQTKKIPVLPPIDTFDVPAKFQGLKYFSFPSDL